MCEYGRCVGADVVRWSAREAQQRGADPALLDDLVDIAAVVIDCRDARPDPLSLGPLRRAACVVLAVADDDAAQLPVDLVITPGADTALLSSDTEGAVDALVRAAVANPRATGVLAQLLRVTPGLPVEDALLAESWAYSLLLAGAEFRAWLAANPPRPHRHGDEPAVLVSRDDEVLRLTLNRPQVRNAYDAALRDALVAGLQLAEGDPSVVRVELRGNGPSFCSGGDLSEFGACEDPVVAHAIRTTRSAAAHLARVAARTEVRLHGACVGAGVELPAFAGRVVAAPDTTLRLPEVAMGLVPGAGGTVSLPRRIGAARTLLLALSGLTLGARDALRWGLVDDIAAESDVFA